MLFNSVTFLIFLAIVAVLWWQLPRRPRLWMTLAASLTFYGFWRVEFIPVMLFSTVIDYFVAIKLQTTEAAGRRRSLLMVSLVANLGLLFVFKYLDFFLDNAVSLADLLGLEITKPTLSIVLPLGISFYTFQTLSYTIDVYRRFIPAERDFVLYANYVTFFPQLVAGPILRAREVLSQLSERRPFDLSHIDVGLRRLLYGLFLKVCIADGIAPLVDEGYLVDPSELSGVDVWTLAFLFGFQIYFDFCAYSHVALGCASLLGVEFPENFNFPYVASSPRDFWRRWHISLSSWIRDYLYLPLTGAQVHDHSSGGLATAANVNQPDRRNSALFLTWAIMGLWHGAAWKFVVWGLWHATVIFIYRLTEPRVHHLPEKVRLVGGWALTLAAAMLAWIPFRAADMSHTLRMYQRLFIFDGYFSRNLSENTYLISAVLLIAILAANLITTRLAPWLRERPLLFVPLETVKFTVLILATFVFLRPILQYIYFQF